MSALNPWDGFDNFYEFSSSSYRGGIGVFGGADYFFKLNDEEAYQKAYNLCPPLKSIISKRAKAFNVGVMDVYDKAGVIAKVAKADALRNLLAKPNPLQTRRQFMAQQNAYIDVHGYCPVLRIFPIGRPDKITSIWNIPPWLWEPIYTENWVLGDERHIITGFRYRFNGINVDNIDVNAIKLIFDDGFGTDNDINLTIPDSRLRGQEYPISNIIAALKSRNSLITKKGAIGILSNDAKDVGGHVPMRNGEKESVQNDFKRYGITGQDFQVIITDASLKWQQMSFSTKDLMLFEEVAEDVSHLCDAYDFPPQLMALQRDPTYQNIEHAEKKMYTGSIIPESNSRLEQLTSALVVGDDLHIRSDFSAVDVLQENKKDAADVRRIQTQSANVEFQNNVITLNEWRIELGYEAVKSNGDKFYYELIADGWVFGSVSSGSASAT